MSSQEPQDVTRARAWEGWQAEMARAAVGFVRLGRVIAAFVYVVVLIALALLTLAFFLRLFGANPKADFADWVYRSVDGIMDPFRGMFPKEQLTDRSVLDFSLLFAMILYSMIAIALHAIIRWLTFLHLPTRARYERRFDEGASFGAPPPPPARDPVTRPPR